MEIQASALKEGLGYFEADDAVLQRLGGEEVFSIGQSPDRGAYAYQKKGQDYVLKLIRTPPDRINVFAQRLDYVSYLADHGVRLCRPLHSSAGHLFETVRDGDDLYLVTKTEKAPGEHVFGRNETLNDSLFQEWGRVVGQTHALAKTYHGGEQIESWDAEFALFDGLCQDEQVRARWREVDAAFQALPRTPGGYGLVHNDLHPENFLVHEGKITLLDFDVCMWHWDMVDIAMALYCVSTGMVSSPDPSTDHGTFVRRFFQQFMTGYSEENHLDPFWIEQMPVFFKHRLILPFIMYAGEMQTRGDPNYEPWRDAILQDVQIIDPEVWRNL